MTNQIEKLQEAIQQLHGCESKHVESVPVQESAGGTIVWDGIVEIFDLVDHPDAKQCFAWSYQQDDGSDRYIAVLALKPVTCPLDAVRASIVEDYRKRHSGGINNEDP